MLSDAISGLLVYASQKKKKIFFIASNKIRIMTVAKMKYFYYSYKCLYFTFNSWFYGTPKKKQVDDKF